MNLWGSIMEETKLIWFNGKMVPWNDCKIHFLTHTLHYGGGVFEGIRCYETPKGPAIFRLNEHIQRLFFSASVLGMEIPFSEQQLIDATIKTVKDNEVKSCYIRPLAFYGYGKMGLATNGAKVDVGIAVWPWGAYLGEEGLINGVSIKISPFVRPPKECMPTHAKVCGNYANSILAKMDAIKTNFADALLLDLNGNVAECSGENIFFVKNGVLVTPALDNCLDGITRKSVIAIAGDLGIAVQEKKISKQEMFLMDECFMTGTAAEMTPVSMIDGKPIGLGKPGIVTKKIQEKFFEAIKGKEPKYEKWLTYVI
jgi:branched-chain amino acid aminotransferase